MTIFYFRATEISPALCVMSKTTGVGTDYDTIITVGKNPACAYFLVRPELEQKTYVTALPTECTKEGWRSEYPLAGKFEAGEWHVYLVLHAISKYGGHQIKIYARLWKVNADLSVVTPLTDWVASPNIITIPDQAVCSTVSDDFSLGTLPEIDMAGNYLFIEFAHHVEVAGDSGFCAQVQQKESVDGRERLVTPLYADKWVSAVDSGTGYFPTPIKQLASVQERSPSAYQLGVDWVNPELAYASDDQEAYSKIDSAEVAYKNYGFNLTGAEILVVKLKLEHRDAGGSHKGVRVSWDGGTTYGAERTLPTRETETIDTVDVSKDTEWTPEKLSDLYLRYKLICHK